MSLRSCVKFLMNFFVFLLDFQILFTCCSFFKACHFFFLPRTLGISCQDVQSPLTWVLFYTCMMHVPVLKWLNKQQLWSNTKIGLKMSEKASDVQRKLENEIPLKMTRKSHSLEGKYKRNKGWLKNFVHYSIINKSEIRSVAANQTI